MWIGDRGWNAFAQEIQHALRIDAYDSLQRLSMDFFEDSRTGELLSIINNDVNQLEDFLSTSFSDALRLVVMVIGVGFILFLLNPELTIVAMFPVPIIAILAYLFVRNIHPKYVSMRSSVGGLTSRLEDNLSGIEVINTESTKPYEKGRVSDSSSEYYNTPSNFDGSFTATFAYQSTVAKKILKQKKTNVQFCRLSDRQRLRGKNPVYG